jgi:SAM-dependent methyltransferase
VAFGGRPNQIAVDVGCGPGYASLDLAELVGESGRVVAVDKSERFLNALDTMRRERGLRNITTCRADLDTGEFPEVTADCAWCRWIFAFVKNPREILARVAAALKPGGIIVIHEYFDYATWRTIPPCAEVAEFVSAVMASWRDNGGEPDIALCLPGWLQELGFELRAVHPIIEAVKREQLAWAWLRAFIEINRQRLVDLGYVTHDRAEFIWQSFTSLEAEPGTRMITPGVLEIIAVRA